MRRRERGFTLIEMLIVIIIIVILAGASVALLNAMLRGQGVKQGAMIVTQAVAEAKQQAAKTHKVVFLVFSPLGGGAAGGAAGPEGWLEIHMDKNEDGVYQGDQKLDSQDSDPAIEGLKIDLPRFVVFEGAPVWIGFSPSGYITFSPGFKEVQASTFDAVMNGSNPRAIGDVILRMSGRGFYMCVDLDRASGKVRRSFFLNQE
jgi:prepilin-type N-terminal cleavage/methylation domain-containing protein